MEKIAAMGICQLGIFRRDFSYDLLCDFCEVPGTRCMFCEDYRASRNNTVEDTHGQLLTSWNSNKHKHDNNPPTFIIHATHITPLHENKTK